MNAQTEKRKMAEQNERIAVRHPELSQRWAEARAEWIAAAVGDDKEKRRAALDRYNAVDAEYVEAIVEDWTIQAPPSPALSRLLKKEGLA